MSCKCQDCNEEFKVDIIVDNKIWRKITPKSTGDGSGGLLCGKCIIKRLENLGYNAFRLNIIY